MVFIAKKLFDLNFEIIATRGTYKTFRSSNIDVQMVGKISEGDTKILVMMKKNELRLIINTPSGEKCRYDIKPMRSLAVMQGVPCITTV